MKRKTISFALTLCIIIATCSLVFSAVTLYFEMPMSATVEEKASLLIYVDELPWINGTNVPFGTVDPGSVNTKNMTIKNTGNVALQISLSVSGLPSGWDLTYNRNGNIVQPKNWLNGTLTLTVSSSAVNGTYNWEAYISAIRS